MPGVTQSIYPDAQTPRDAHSKLTRKPQFMPVEGDGDIRYVPDRVLKGPSTRTPDGAGGLLSPGFDKSHCGESGIMFSGFPESAIA